MWRIKRLIKSATSGKRKRGAQERENCFKPEELKGVNMAGMGSRRKNCFSFSGGKHRRQIKEISYPASIVGK